MADYDVAKAFKRIEDELISSMIDNLKHHRAEETKEGIQWTQWQTEQLKALEIYKKQNKNKYSDKFTEINSNVESAIQKAYETGGMEQEIKILKAIQKGYKGYVRVFKGTTATDGNFFKVNERKLNALIESTVNDMQKAEHAVLRRAEDQYRKIIFDAQVYANSGGVTYEKAVDMATHDFLSAGIRCIEYKNGARHTIADYADMAIKTATKRAYLRGEGTKRNEWGISTVIVNKRSNPCPLCLPFVAKILIDDVYSGGSSADGDYPLLSTAMEMGFLHPRCKDHFTTYFEGISTPPKEQQLTQADLLKIKEQNELEKKKRFAENQQKRMKRLAEHSLDKDNKKIYSSRADEWQKKSEEISKKLDKPVEKSTEDKEHLTNGGTTEEYNKLKAQGVTSTKAAKHNEKEIKSREEALQALKDMGFDVDTKSDYSLLDEKLFIENVKQLQVLEQRFGAIRGGKTKFSLDADEFPERAIASIRTNWNKDGVSYSKEMILNPELYKDAKTFIEIHTGSTKRGYAMPCADSKHGVYTVIHEYGHLLQDRIILKEYDIVLSEYIEKAAKADEYLKQAQDFKTPRTGEERMQIFENWQKHKKEATNIQYQLEGMKRNESKAKAMNDEIRHIAKELMREEDDYFKDVPDEQMSLAGYMSGYGQSSEFEFFAEAFANALCGEPNIVGQATEIWLKQQGW